MELFFPKIIGSTVWQHTESNMAVLYRLYALCMRPNIYNIHCCLMQSSNESHHNNDTLLGARRCPDRNVLQIPIYDLGDLYYGPLQIYG